MNSLFLAADKECVPGTPPTENWAPLCEQRAR